MHRTAMRLLAAVGVIVVLVGLPVSGAQAQTSGDWSTYLNNGARTGYNGAEWHITPSTAPKLTKQWTDSAGGSISAEPIQVNGTLYYGSNDDRLKAFPITNAIIASTPSSQSATSFSYPGTTPGISASGATNGIVWAVENSSPAVLHAYDATNLARELYNSTQAGARDSFGAGNKFITPTIVNGHVFVGTQTGVAVFGSLLPATPTNVHIVRGS